MAVPYSGHIEKGAVVLDEPAALPDGTKVTVAPLDDAQAPTLAEQLSDVVGIAQGLPEDMAKNHDHYIHGAPRK